MDEVRAPKLHTATAFFLGAVIGGSIAAFVLLLPAAALMTYAPGPIPFVLAAVVVLAVMLGTLGFMRLPLVTRQARPSLGTLPPTVAAFVFGMELGTGVRTFTSSVVLYLLTVPALLSTPPSQLVLAGAAFGAVRGLVPVDTVLLKERAAYVKWLGDGDRAISVAKWIAILMTSGGLLFAATHA